MSNFATQAAGVAAYRQRRTPKQSEAEVFAQANRAIAAANAGSELDHARAVADNRRLWTAVHASVADPSNALPQELRGQIAGVALVVIRECNNPAPDLAFVASINEQFAAGLWS